MHRPDGGNETNDIPYVLPWHAGRTILFMYLSFERLVFGFSFIPLSLPLSTRAPLNEISTIMPNPAPSTTLELVKTLIKRIIRIIAAFLKYLTLFVFLLACIGGLITTRYHARVERNKHGLEGLGRQQQYGHAGGVPRSSPSQPLRPKSGPAPRQKLSGFGQHPRQYTMYKKNGDPVTAQERAEVQKMMDRIVDRMMSKSSAFDSTSGREETAGQQRASSEERKENRRRNKKTYKGTANGDIERNTQLEMDDIIANLELQVGKEGADIVRGVRDQLVSTVGWERAREAAREGYRKPKSKGKVNRKKSSHKNSATNRKSITLTRSDGSAVKRKTAQPRKRTE